MSVVVIAPADLKALIAEAVSAAIAAHDQGRLVRPLSAREAARQARRAPAKVLAALKSGALRGTQDDGAWRIPPAALADWIEAGCPLAAGRPNPATDRPKFRHQVR